jgi:hypothetical protein
MAAPGQNFNQTIFVSEQPEAVSQALIASASGVPGYTLNTAGTGSIVLTRKFTPTWAIVVAVLGILVFLVGLLALLVKETETLTVTLTPVEGGTRVAVSGVATHDMMTRIGAAFHTMPALAPEGQPNPLVNTVEGTKVCPACAETVKTAAKVCRFCSHEFEADPTPVIV